MVPNSGGMVGLSGPTQSPTSAGCRGDGVGCTRPRGHWGAHVVSTDQDPPNEIAAPSLAQEKGSSVSNGTAEEVPTARSLFLRWRSAARETAPPLSMFAASQNFDENENHCMTRTPVDEKPCSSEIIFAASKIEVALEIVQSRDPPLPNDCDASASASQIDIEVD
jgi:hypothetical protein